MSDVDNRAEAQNFMNAVVSGVAANKEERSKSSTTSPQHKNTFVLDDRGRKGPSTGMGSDQGGKDLHILSSIKETRNKCYKEIGNTEETLRKDMQLAKCNFAAFLQSKISMLESKANILKLKYIDYKKCSDRINVSLLFLTSSLTVIETTKGKRTIP